MAKGTTVVEDNLVGGLAWATIGDFLVEARRENGVWRAEAFSVLREKLAEVEADTWWEAMERAAEAAEKAKKGAGRERGTDAGGACEARRKAEEGAAGHQGRD